MDLVHAGHIEHDAAAVERGVVVASPRTARSNGQFMFFGKVKDLVDFRCANRAEAVGRRT